MTTLLIEGPRSEVLEIIRSLTSDPEDANPRRIITRELDNNVMQAEVVLAKKTLRYGDLTRV